MRRHVIIGRFGLLDRTSVQIAADEVVTRIDLVQSEKRLDYGIGRALEDLGQLGIFPSEIGLDLLVIAALVHAADTRISRATESQDTWTREIRIVVPVSDLVRWSDTAAFIERILDFLSGDKWIITFRPRPRGFASIVPTHPGRMISLPFDSLSLFSGGLDSLIGAIDMIEGGGTPLLISHAGEGATSDAQNACFETLKAHYNRTSFDRLRLWMNFPKNLVRGVASEKTTRSRSFLFIAIGIFVGTGFEGNFTLRVPENGLIALNVPLDPLRLGALSTRTTHPFYMTRWNELLSMLDINGDIVNPYWDKTKGEMVANCGNPTLLAQIIPNALSCSSPTKGRWQRHGIEHCGYCLPCIIRRAAILAGLRRRTDPTNYTLANLATRPLDTRKAEGQQVRSFHLAIKRLQSHPELAKLLIHKPGPLSEESTANLAALADVYLRGMNEVGALLARVRTQPH